MKIVSIINQKGGVGKSTISVNLSYELTLLKKKVLLIDLDPQGHSSCIFCPHMDQERTISNIFSNKNIKSTEVIYQAKIRNDDNNEYKEIDNLYIIPSSIKLALTAEQSLSKIYREAIIKNFLENMDEDFDFVIIDCPPTLGLLAINAIFASDTILIPTNFGRYSLDGMADLLSSIEEIKDESPYSYFILRNMYEKRNSKTNKYINDQLSVIKERILGTVIRKCEAVNQSQIKELPVKIFKPTSSSVEDFEQLTKEFILNVT